MKCPFCQHNELKVIDSREATEANAIRRRRECLECNKRFTTFETVDLTMQVYKREGTYENFEQQKLINGLMAACHRTTISHDHVLDLAAKITSELFDKPSNVITSEEIGAIVMNHLQKLDPIAYIRFACVYKRFKEIHELMDAIQEVHPKDKKKLPEEVTHGP
ncbi:MAG: transcriptional repressor NrdR [Chlamydiia bacterium]|nr:transcriptional repressor NrdR [Chlamydiia bacterium]